MLWSRTPDHHSLPFRGTGASAGDEGKRGRDSVLGAHIRRRCEVAERGVDLIRLGQVQANCYGDKNPCIPRKSRKNNNLGVATRHWFGMGGTVCRYCGKTKREIHGTKRAGP